MKIFVVFALLFFPVLSYAGNMPSGPAYPQGWDSWVQTRKLELQSDKAAREADRCLDLNVKVYMALKALVKPGPLSKSEINDALCLIGERDAVCGFYSQAYTDLSELLELIPNK